VTPIERLVRKAEEIVHRPPKYRKETTPIARLDPCVVDTNVAVVANARSTAGERCGSVCAKRLLDIVAGGHVVIDDSYLIMGEYRKNLSSGGQPRAGDRFYHWLLANYSNPKRCTRVPITPGPNGSYEEFPEHPRFRGFDRSDHKFIAVAAAHPERPAVLQAFDAKWWGYRDAFDACGIVVEFLCAAVIRVKYEEKVGRKCS